MAGHFHLSEPHQSHREVVQVEGWPAKARTITQRQGLHPESCLWLGLGNKSTLISFALTKVL